MTGKAEQHIVILEVRFRIGVFRLKIDSNETKTFTFSEENVL